jgi:hypothetical protein
MQMTGQVDCKRLVNCAAITRSRIGHNPAPPLKKCNCRGDLGFRLENNNGRVGFAGGVERGQMASGLFGLEFKMTL